MTTPTVEEIVKKFDTFVKKWCVDSVPHLLDSDDNDGEDFRQSLLTYGAEREAKGREEILGQLEDMKHLVSWLAKLYQVNYNTFAPQIDAPEWKIEAYMHFSTVQGGRNRQQVEKVASIPHITERVSRALTALTTPREDNHKEV